MKHWIEAARPRTLPLALASIGMGSFLAAGQGAFSWDIFVLCSLTTILLQVLSNFANDYGDSIHGADSQDREGPSRAVQSGVITSTGMRNAVILFSILSLVCGLSLLYVSLSNWNEFLGFLGLGVLSIIAAITYTAGKKPYGYAGLGDISVIIFFGLVGVLGTLYLYTKSFDWVYVLPAISSGLFATGVLNVNNIRDIESDIKAGKKSVPVRLGREAAVWYHKFLLNGGMICAVVFTMLDFRSGWQLMFLVTLPLLRKNEKAVRTLTKPSELDPYLKQMAMTSLLFMLTFGAGYVLSR
ncbi:1,4-dihydroxy-2-naphthoate polyprenyltransferase [Limibacter armeniacum]|uniref:1,4-dihydroxy-2-naphthoate polyprenyltransferase n=1 Tax=Limibacter armeniacum TaxID=466084 RepID=UPI002FE582FD